MNALTGLNPRERMLLLITGVVVAAFLVVAGGVSGRRYFGELDRRIGQLEGELVNVSAQVAQKETVDKAFSAVIAEHGSAWSVQEIHTNLRREVYRLALLKPPPPGFDPPVNGAYMVGIPTLAQGTLREEGEGYREYQIQFTIPNARIPHGLRFLERLLTSPQILRVEGFEMWRDPSASNRGRFAFDVTRTVIDINDPLLQSSVGQQSSVEPRSIDHRDFSGD